jgi:hypothetical protein
LTYRSAKRVVKSSFERRAEDHVLHMMFVAVTRAACWVYLSTVASRMEPLAAAMTIRSARPSIGMPPSPPAHARTALMIGLPDAPRRCTPRNLQGNPTKELK